LDKYINASKGPWITKEEKERLINTKAIQKRKTKKTISDERENSVGDLKKEFITAATR
jgi:hypothetical protein